MQIVKHLRAASSNLYHYLFWRSLANQEKASLLRCINGSHEFSRAAQWFAAFDKGKAWEVESELQRLRGRCEKITVSSRMGGHSKQLAKIRGEFQSASRRLEELAEYAKSGRERWEVMSAAAHDCRERAAVIPGRLFEQENTRMAKEYSRLHIVVPGCKRKLDLIDSFERVGKCLEKWDRLVAVAEQVRAGIPQLEQDLSTIDPVDAAYNVVTQQSFAAVQGSIPRMKEFVVEGNYEAAKPLLDQNRNRHRELVKIVERRHEWAREEIDLWLSAPSVVAAFPRLREYGERLTPLEISDWRDVLCPQIEQFVNARAAEARTNAGAVLKREDKKLDISWPDVQSQEHLKRFVRAVAKRC